MPSEPEAAPENQAPYFFINPQDTFSRGKVLDDVTSPVPSIILGATYDNEDDAIIATFECITCQDEEAEYFTFNEETMIIDISSEVQFNTYYFNLTLKDANVDPKSKKYNFRLKVEEIEPPEEEVQVFVNDFDPKLQEE